MSNNQKYLQELYAEIKGWKNKLAFYEDDLRVLKSRLGEVSAKNSDQEVHALVERFQNKMIIQQEQLDILNHDLNTAAQTIQENIENNPQASDHRKADDHAGMRDRVNTFELLFNDLRRDLVGFTARWM